MMTGALVTFDQTIGGDRLVVCWRTKPLAVFVQESVTWREAAEKPAVSAGWSAAATATENSDVSFEGSVAVAVRSWPRGTALDNTTVNFCVQLPPVVT